MPAPNTLIRKGQLDPGLRSFTIDFGPITTPANGTYIVALKTSHPLNIDEVSVQTSAGTVTAQLRINNVPVALEGGGSTIACSSSINTKSTASEFAAGTGAQLTLVLSANAASANLNVSIGCSRA